MKLQILRRSKREALGSTETSCSTTGEACLRVGQTPRRAETEAETGLRTQLILRSLERQLRGVPAPFVGCYSYLVTLLLWPANWRFSSDSVSYFLYSSVLNAFWKNLLITTCFLSSEATHSCTDWLRKVRTPAGGRMPSETEGKKWRKKRLKEKRNEVTQLRDIWRHSLFRNEHCSMRISTDRKGMITTRNFTGALKILLEASFLRNSQLCGVLKRPIQEWPRFSFWLCW